MYQHVHFLMVQQIHNQPYGLMSVCPMKSGRLS